MLCAFLFFINHPMVKVKVEDKVAQDAAGVGFNHPMVKVKGTRTVTSLRRQRVSTTLW